MGKPVGEGIDPENGVNAVRSRYTRGANSLRKSVIQCEAQFGKFIGVAVIVSLRFGLVFQV